MVFENMVLRGTSVTQMQEVTLRWRKLQDEELHNLYSSPNTITTINWRTRWTMQGEDKKYTFWSENLERRDN
jgi:hypothetical protein